MPTGNAVVTQNYGRRLQWLYHAMNRICYAIAVVSRSLAHLNTDAWRTRLEFWHSPSKRELFGIRIIFLCKWFNTRLGHYAKLNLLELWYYELFLHRSVAMDQQELYHWWTVYIGDELHQRRRVRRYVFIMSPPESRGNVACQFRTIFTISILQTVPRTLADSLRCN